jgi:acrylyl-CoA reductase (NADPH)
MFRAMWVEETSSGSFARRVIERSRADLPGGTMPGGRMPGGDLLVRVEYSSLNYKDALSATGSRGVTRRYPHTPGIDAAGVVEESADPAFAPGESVLIAALEMGVSTPGGFGQYVRVPSEWAVRLPAGMSARQAMAFGTAGFTAALCLERLQREGIRPQDGEILVTGATGGVGSIALALLAREGYTTAAVTGKPEQAGLLRSLGASAVLSREEAGDDSGRPLLHARWAGVIDTVGGPILSAAVRSTRPGGVVTACGNAASPDLPLTVFPFILRGVTLAGIDASAPPRPERERIWQKLAADWKLDLEALIREVGLDDLSAEIERILQGGQVGRVLVNLWK